MSSIPSRAKVRAKSAKAKNAPASTGPASESFRIAEYPFYRVARVATLYSECLDRELKPRGMDQPRWRVLMILNEHNPAAMGTIAELAAMKLPTLLKVLQRMSEEGLVRTAARISDNRVTEVSITPRGRKSLALVRKVAAEVYAQVIEQFSAEDIETLNALLGALESSLLELRRQWRRPAAANG